MDYCGNCGQALSGPGTVCANCGYYPLPKQAESGAAREWGMGILGFVLAFVSVITIVGPLVLIAVYLSIRESQPAFARGLGFGLIALVVTGLGAIALCFAALSGFNH